MRISIFTKIAIKEIKMLMVAAAILDIESEDRRIRIFPSLNPYYYKIKSLEKGKYIKLD